MRCVVILGLALPGAASAGKVEKAEKALAAFAEGDRDAIAKAVALADAAGDEPAARAVQCRAWTELVANPDLPRPEADPVPVAVAACEAADGVTQSVLRLESAVVALLVNDVEGKAWADASTRLDLALRVRAAAAPDPEREAALRRLAVRVTSRSDPAAAREHYEALVAATGVHESALATVVARAMAEAGDLDGALALLAPLDREMPDDERLLRTEVELLQAGGRGADGAARVARAEAELVGSVSGAWLAGTLYAAVGAEDRARAMWERVVALDPRHVDARLALGSSLTALGAARKAELVRREDASVPRPAAEVRALVAELTDAFRRAEEHLAAARASDPSSVPVREALVALYEAKLAGVDPTRLRRTERDAVEADLRKLAALRAEGAP